MEDARPRRGIARGVDSRVLVQYEIEANGRIRRAVVHRTNRTFVIEIDGRTWTVDAARVDAQSLSLLVDSRLPPSDADNKEDGRLQSFEVMVVPDAVSGRLIVTVGARSVAVVLNGRRRWGRKGDGGGHAGEGPQNIVAPMPGKIVRVLVAVGQVVRARQPVVVVEAMKMENELRAGRDGIVTEVKVREGQSVEAGGLLAVIAPNEG
jgi:biotin carboxyl carrier protein